MSALNSFKLKAKKFIVQFTGFLSPHRRHLTGIRQQNSSFIALFLKNLLSPQHLYQRAIYGQALWVPPFVRKGAKPLPIDLSAEESDFVKQRVADLKRDGYVILDRFFEKEVEELLRTYRIGRTSYPPTAVYSSEANAQITDDATACAMATNPQLLSIYGEYYGRQPYLRIEPRIIQAHPNYDSFPEQASDTFDSIAQQGIPTAVLWHWDTPNQLIVWTALEDIDPNGTRMLYAKGMHRLFHRSLLHARQPEGADNFFSESFLREVAEIIPLAAPKGSVIIFDSNGPHRFFPVKESYRGLFNVLVTPGNDVLTTNSAAPSALRDGQRPKRPDLAALAPGQKEFLRTLYDV